MKLCKFPGMTRAQYERNLQALLTLCSTRGRMFREVKLGSNGLPDVRPDINELLGGMYRKPERPKTGYREAERRRRQQAA